MAEQAHLGVLERQVAVCFADIVGWTELSEEADDAPIGSVADRLTAMATNLLRPPVRLVKMIGDAAMFVSPDTRAPLGRLVRAPCQAREPRVLRARPSSVLVTEPVADACGGDG